MAGSQNPEVIHEITSAFEWQPDRSAFPVATPEAVERMSEAGYEKFGFAFGIEDPLGRVLIYPHREQGHDQVTDQQWGIPSETVQGLFNGDMLVEVETVEEGLVRCLMEEQGLDLEVSPENAQLSYNPHKPFTFFNWPMSEGDETGTFSYTISVRANHSMAVFIALNQAGSNEAYPGFFNSKQFLQNRIDEGDARFSTDVWLANHSSLPSSTRSIGQPLPLHPRRETGGNHWRDLRFREAALTLGHSAVDEASAS